MLRDYQIEDARCLAHHTRALVASEMRTGKTPTSIGAAALTGCHKWIVVSPRSLCSNWVREWGRFGTGEAHEAKTVVLGPGVSVLNIHRLPAVLCRATKRIGKEGRAFLSSLGEYGVIVDEAHLCLSQTSMMARRLRHLIQGAKYAWLLTGTPIRTSVVDAWTIAWMLGIEKRLYGSWPQFCIESGGGFADNRWQVGNKHEVVRALDIIKIRRTRAEVAAYLCGVDYEWQVVDGAVPKIIKDAMRRPGSGLPDIREMTGALIAQAMERVSEAVTWAELAEQAKAPALVFSAFRAPLTAFAERPGWVVVDGDGGRDWLGRTYSRDEVVAKHRDFVGIASTIGALGVGHTIDGIERILFIDQTWVPGDNRQAADRAIGSNKNNVLVTIFVTDDPLDQRHQRRLADRGALLDMALSSPRL
jgi:SWI/SNF-related matrix-associated actin-dependent regulator 1 of chromatin subfamily A